MIIKKTSRKTHNLVFCLIKYIQNEKSKTPQYLYSEKLASSRIGEHVSIAQSETWEQWNRTEETVEAFSK